VNTKFRRRFPVLKMDGALMKSSGCLRGSCLTTAGSPYCLGGPAPLGYLLALCMLNIAGSGSPTQAPLSADPQALLSARATL
jgi:hypothetical protein